LNGVIMNWNASAERIFGYSAAEITGSSITNLIPAELQPEEERIRERVKNGERIREFKTIRLRKDGTPIDVAITVSPIYDSAGHAVGASKIVRELTEEKQIQAALQQSEARFRQLADSMPDIVWGSSPNGVLDYYNRRWYEFSGRSETGEGKRTPVVHPGDLGRCSDAWEDAISSGKPYKIEYRLRDHRTGEYRWHLGRALPVRNGGEKIVRWYGTATDIHELKTAQAELEGAQQTLEERVQERTTQLASANAELETFSYSVSHDLRAPLRAISGFSRILAEEHAGSLDTEGMRYLRTVQDGAQQMGQLVDDLLAFSRLGREALKLRELNSRELVDAALATLEPMREGRSVELTIQRLPAVHGDATLLKQVWVNLISNALKYTRERDPAVIVIGSRRERNTDVFFVQDNGAGFDMKYADKLFGVFQRLHRAEDYEGTGVGLALVQRIIHRHGGAIWATRRKTSARHFSSHSRR
jgi:PAS domain S-box-containing protein